MARSTRAIPACCYPWSAELDDGRVLVFHWHRYEDEHQAVKAAMIEEP